MAVSEELREADKAARIAILNQIASEVELGRYALVDLARAYNLVAQTDAPREPAKAPSVGGFA